MRCNNIVELLKKDILFSEGRSRDKTSSGRRRMERSTESDSKIKWMTNDEQESGAFRGGIFGRGARRNKTSISRCAQDLMPEKCTGAELCSSRDSVTE